MVLENYCKQEASRRTEERSAMKKLLVYEVFVDNHRSFAWFTIVMRKYIIAQCSTIKNKYSIKTSYCLLTDYVLI